MRRLRQREWDEFAIKAEIRRRGMTLTTLANTAGLPPSSIRAAFLKPSIGANRAIAQFLGLSVQELWPDWFGANGKLIPAVQRNSNRKTEARESVGAA